MKLLKTKSEYIKLAGMLLVIILCILYFDIIDHVKNKNNSPAIFYLSVGMIFSYLIWSSMKIGKFKKRVFWCFTIPYWVFVLYIFISRFRFHFDEIWHYYHSFGIAIAMVTMLPLCIVLYRLGMKEKQQEPENTKTETTEPANIELTEDFIDTAKDDELLQLILNNLMEKVSAVTTDEVEALRQLSKPQQAIYTIWCFETELSNDGFMQYYSKYDNRFTDLVPDFLKLIGAEQFADLHIKADQIYKSEYNSIAKHQNGTKKEVKLLETLDNDFFDIYAKENIQQLQVDFIRANKMWFIGGTEI